MQGFVDKLSAKGGALVGGVLCGTSGDGIDVVFVRISVTEGASGLELSAPELFAARTQPFSTALERRVRRALDGAPPGSYGEVARLHRDLGCAFGAAAHDLAAEHGLTPDLLGSHGLTVFHHDGAPDAEQRAAGPASTGLAATLQLGDGDFVAAAAGCDVVSDFRQADVAAGGEGAPLSPLADGWIFARAPRPLWVLNLGGMANLTLIEADGSGCAFDTGPANALLDGLARRLFERAYDAGGELAARGRVHSPFVEAVLAHPFFDRVPPKSCGRDSFGPSWIDALLETTAAQEVAPEDLLASAVEALARSIAEALQRFAADRPAAAALYVAGGGVHHPGLMQALGRSLAPVSVRSSVAAGVDPDFREGLVFAHLAVLFQLRASRARWATGAPLERVCGKLSICVRAVRPGRGSGRSPSRSTGRRAGQ